MRVIHQDYSELRLLSGIMADYQKRNPSLLPFIQDFPSLEGILESASKRAFPVASRINLHNALKNQYAQTATDAAVQRNLESLLSEKTFTITTGHQLCVATGPAFFIYKIISAIKLAQQLNNAGSEMHFVPVYWMASEDHDFEEVNHVFVQGKKLSWNGNSGGAVGRLSTLEMDAFWEEVKTAWSTEPAWSMEVEKIRKHYQETTLSLATFGLVNELFGKYGLVVIDADNALLKSEFAAHMMRELNEQPSESAVVQASQELERLGYHTQVSPRNINLFYLGENSRERLIFENNGWKVNKSSVTFNESTMQRAMDDHPENFSPNVVLRPVYQEVVLPNVVYIGGPGEINYWFQLKKVFEVFSVAFPVLVLRNNALVISKKTQERIEKTGLHWKDFFQSKEDLIRSVVGTDQQEQMNGYKNRLQELYAELASVLSATDATLDASTKAEAQRAINGLDNLEKKLTRALKTKEEQRIQQIERILQELKPNEATQDRTANFFELNIKSHGSLIENLMESFDPLNNSYTIVFAD